MDLSVCSIVASAGRWELEGLDGKGEILIIRIEGEEPVVDALLNTLGFVAWSNQGAGLSSSGALLNSKQILNKAPESRYWIMNNLNKRHLSHLFYLAVWVRVS